jgi:hypothetical protein
VVGNENERWWAVSSKPEEPTAQLARDEFTRKRHELDNTPEAVKTSNRIDIVDQTTTEITTWLIDQYRFDGRVTMFVQVGKPDGYIRIMVPPKVMAAIANAGDALVSKQRRQTARRVVSDRLARGEKLGNPEALAAARRAPRKRRRRARKQGQA